MTYALSFGGYALPPGLYVAMNPTNRAVTATKLPRRHGSRLMDSGLTEKRLTLQGGIVAAAPGNLRGTLDALHAALQSGPANFTTEDDRYYRNCLLGTFSDNYDPTGWNYITTIRAEIIAGDPFCYEVATQTMTVAITANPQTMTVAAGGTAPALPKLELTVGSGVTALALTVTNATTGKACTITGAVTAGDVIAIDSLQESVTTAGVDKMLLFDGLFPDLAVGANSITLAGTGISAVKFTWQNRYY